MSQGHIMYVGGFEYIKGFSEVEGNEEKCLDLNC